MRRRAQTIRKCGTKVLSQSGNQHYETSHFLSQLCFSVLKWRQWFYKRKVSKAGTVFFLGGGGGGRVGGGESVKEYELKVTFPRFFLVFTLKNNKPLKFSRFVFPKYWGIWTVLFFQTSTYSYVNVKIIYEKTKDKTLLDISLPTTLRQSLLEYNIAVRWIIMYFAGSCKL